MTFQSKASTRTVISLFSVLVDVALKLPGQNQTDLVPAAVVFYSRLFTVGDDAVCSGVNLMDKADNN